MRRLDPRTPGCKDPAMTDEVGSGTAPRDVDGREDGEARGQDGSEDSQLLADLAAGDATALATLYDRHASWMLAHAYTVLGNRRDAEDLIHDVFLEVWRKAESYEPSRAGVRTWLRVKVRSRALDRLRKRDVARRHGIRPLRDEDEVEDPDSAMEILRNADRSLALEALATLPEGQRMVIELNYLEGISCDEIASRCGLPVGTVKSRLSRGMAVLRDRLVLRDDFVLREEKGPCGGEET